MRFQRRRPRNDPAIPSGYMGELESEHLFINQNRHLAEISAERIGFPRVVIATMREPARLI